MSFNRVLGALAVGSLLVGCSTTLTQDRATTPGQLSQQRLYSLLTEKPCAVTCGCAAAGTFSAEVVGRNLVSFTIDAQEIPSATPINATGSFSYTDPSGNVHTGTIFTIACNSFLGIPFVSVLGATGSGENFQLTYYYASEVSSDPTYISYFFDGSGSEGNVTSGELVRRLGEPCAVGIP